MLSDDDRSLANYLTENEIVSQDNVDAAMDAYRKRGAGRLADFLLMGQYLSAKDLLTVQRALRGEKSDPAAAQEAAAQSQSESESAQPSQKKGRHIRGLTRFTFGKKAKAEVHKHDQSADDEAPTRRKGLTPITGPSPDSPRSPELEGLDGADVTKEVLAALNRLESALLVDPRFSTDEQANVAAFVQQAREAVRKIQEKLSE